MPALDQRTETARDDSYAGGHLEVCRGGNGGPKRVPLSGMHVLVGRSAQAQVVLNHATVSRAHAELVRDPFGRWWLQDLRSTNGTFVNGKRIDDYLLSSGDTIGIGDCVLRLALGAPKVQQESLAPQASSEASGTEADGEVTVLPIQACSEHIGTQHLRKVMALGRSLVGVESRVERLRTMGQFLTGPDFPSERCVVVRLRDKMQPRILAGPYCREGQDEMDSRRISRTVLRALWDRREPVIARHDGSAAVLSESSEIRRLSPVSVSRPFSVVASPLATDNGRVDAVYVELPPHCGNAEWLTLVSLVAEQVQQAELIWETRRQAQISAVIERDLQMARQIQEALVPGSWELPGIEVSVGFEPCRWVGGDYVDAVPMPDGRVLLAVADVCGKGLQAALVASSLHTMVHATVDNGGPLCDIMGRINAYFCSYLPQHAFVTMVAAAVHPQSGAVECISAGHPPAFAIRPDGAVRCLQSCRNLPLGIAKQCLEPEQTTLDHGEVLVLHSDGLAEATNEHGEFLGQDRLAVHLGEIVAESAGASLRDLSRHIFAMLARHRGGCIASDDSTFLVARRRDSHPT